MKLKPETIEKIKLQLWKRYMNESSSFIRQNLSDLINRFNQTTKEYDPAFDEDVCHVDDEVIDNTFAVFEQETDYLKFD